MKVRSLFCMILLAAGALPATALERQELEGRTVVSVIEELRSED